MHSWLKRLDNCVQTDQLHSSISLSVLYNQYQLHWFLQLLVHNFNSLMNHLPNEIALLKEFLINAPIITIMLYTTTMSKMKNTQCNLQIILSIIKILWICLIIYTILFFQSSCHFPPIVELKHSYTIIKRIQSIITQQNLINFALYAFFTLTMSSWTIFDQYSSM